MQVTVWNEYRHEQESSEVASVYPDGIHAAIAEGLEATADEVAVPAAPEELTVQTATLDDPSHGLTPAVLAETDVLTWWGHRAHDEVRDDVVERVVERVRDGMGLLVLHSGHYSKPFKRLMGTSCALKWRENAERERLWVVEPSHPVADGLPESFVVPEAETYGERFDVPAPETLVFVSWFEGGEVFRSGCAYRRGNGRVFYFRPGHETHPIYYDGTVRRALANAVAWAAPGEGPSPTFDSAAPVEGPDRVPADPDE
jgi:trehalose utilization protein